MNRFWIGFASGNIVGIIIVAAGMYLLAVDALWKFEENMGMDYSN